MIVCPNCKHKELEGTFFCAECGAQLVAVDPLSTQALQRNSSNSLTSPFLIVPTAPLVAGTEGAELLISLNFVEKGHVMHLAGKSEFILGRIADGQSQTPDIDLTPYEAYGQGVSRLHAVLKINRQRCYIVDLGSSNGTRVNGQKISPQTEYLVNHGDVVALGKLKIQVLVRKPGNSLQ